MEGFNPARSMFPAIFTFCSEHARGLCAGRGEEAVACTHAHQQIRAASLSV